MAVKWVYCAKIEISVDAATKECLDAFVKSVKENANKIRISEYSECRWCACGEGKGMHVERLSNVI